MVSVTPEVKFKAKGELKQIREKQYFQSEMASLISLKTGKKMSRIGYWLRENGRREVNSETAVTIARLLKVPVETIFIAVNNEQPVQS